MSPATTLLHRPRTSARAFTKLACLALVSASCAALAACGSSSSTGTTADPASVVPAAAALYAGATVRPSGAQKTAALAAGKALTHEANPYLRLLGTLQTPGSGQLSFSRDLAPWLGPHAGIFLTSLGSSSALPSLLEQGLLGRSNSAGFAFGADGAQGAIVLDTSDSAKARSFLDAQAAKAGAHATSYRGVAYEVSADGVAFGVVDRFAVIGSESGLRSVIETSHGGCLAGALQRLLEAARGGAVRCPRPRLLRPAELDCDFRAGRARGDRAGARRRARVEHLAGRICQLADARRRYPRSGAAGAGAGLLAVDPAGRAGARRTARANRGWRSASATSAQASARTSRISRRSPRFRARSGAERPESTAGLSLGGLLQGLLTPLRLLGANSAQARHDFASWMGSAGIFASGASLLELKAAVVIASKNPALSRGRRRQARRRAAQGAAGRSRRCRFPAPTRRSSARISGLPVVLDIADGPARRRSDQVRARPRRSVGASRAEPVRARCRRRAAHRCRQRASAKASSRA